MPLTIKQDHPDNDTLFSVYCGGAYVGRIVFKENVISSMPRWHWIINGVSTAPPKTFLSGYAETLEEAKVETGKAFRAWCDLAGLTDK